jgi:hypothetical protein
MPAPTGTVARILGVSRTFTASSAPTRAGHGAGGKRALLQTSIPICVACVREIVNGRHGRSCNESDRHVSVDCLGRSRRSNLRVKAPANGRSWPDWDHDHLYGLAATRERCYGTALRRARVANEAMLRRRDRCCPQLPSLRGFAQCDGSNAWRAAAVREHRVPQHSNARCGDDVVADLRLDARDCRTAPHRFG